jgi:NADPH:quinone reductase-like Zn-dependent oxidoreductase
MPMMNAACLNAHEGLEHLVYQEVPRPQPGTGEVLVQVHATAITPTEVSWSETWKTASGADRPFPIILGHEFSGIVTALGPGVARSADAPETIIEGMAVYGMNDWDRQGTDAEYCLARPDQLAPKPRALDDVQAAEVPISGLTAWQALFEHAQLAAGQRVLIHGATGGVGSFAVQLAHGKGAHTIGTTSTRYVALARELGADEVVDYTTTRFDEAVHDVDVVLDTVGGETLERSWAVLKPGGVLISITAPPPDSAAKQRATAAGIRSIFFIVEPKQAQLVALGHLLDAGQLRPIVAAVYSLEQAGEAYTRGQDQHQPGKVVLHVDRVS